MNIIEQLEKEQLAALTKKRKVPDFGPGDTLRVNVKVVEGERSRVQAYEGVCIGRAGGGVNENFTVRKISYGEGVERVFPVHSPLIDSIEVVRRGKVRRAKLYYLRNLRGKSARIAEGSHHGGQTTDVEDAGKCARPVNCALRTANDFNPLDVVRGQVREIKLTGETLIDRNAVEEHLGMRAIQTAREHGSELTWCSCLHNRQSGNSAKRVAHALDLFLFNIFRRDHAHAGGRFLFGNFGARSGNDHRFGRRFAG